MVWAIFWAIFSQNQLALPAVTKRPQELGYYLSIYIHKSKTKFKNTGW
jgi:hypothetical protein